VIIIIFFSIVILIEPILRFDLPVPAPRIVSEIIPPVDEIAGSPGSKIRETRDPGSGED